LPFTTIPFNPFNRVARK